MSHAWNACGSHIPQGFKSPILRHSRTPGPRTGGSVVSGFPCHVPLDWDAMQTLRDSLSSDRDRAVFDDLAAARPTVWVPDHLSLIHI